MPWRGWKQGFAKFGLGHNGALDSLGLIEAERIKNQRRTTLQSHIKDGSVKNWSLGLSRDTDDRICAAAIKRSQTMKERFLSGSLVPWSKGLTAADDTRIMANALNLKEGYSLGRYTPWAKGLSKDSDTRVAAMAKNVAIAVGNPELQTRLSQLKMLSREEVQRRIDAVSNKLQFMGSLDDYSGCNDETLQFRCKQCSATQTTSLFKMNDRCYSCFPIDSAEQHEIKEFIMSLGFTPITTRDIIHPYELDVYVEEANFAVEVNGLYWHNESKKNDQAYHDRKTELATAAGIKLLHIFTDEWRDKRDIVKSMIRSRLGKSMKGPYARSCDVVELSDTERRTFFSSNHLDGDVRAFKTFALKFNDSIVAALSVRRPFHTSIVDRLEVARFACALNLSVPGALGRLTKRALSYAAASGKSLMSYVDTRHGDGHSYESVGYRIDHMTKPRFWWTDNVRRFDRFTFKADKTLNETEIEVAARSGVHRIFGCKNKVYILDISII